MWHYVIRQSSSLKLWLLTLHFISGHETKAMLNNNGPRYKRSSLERQMNGDIIWCVVILIVFCLLGAIGCRAWLSTFRVDLSTIPFLLIKDSANYEFFLTFWTFIIILQVCLRNTVLINQIIYLYTSYRKNLFLKMFKD